MSDMALFLPETVCLLGALVLFCAQVFGARYGVVWGLALLSGVAAVVASVWTWPLAGEPFFPGVYRVDFFSQFVKAIIAGGFLFVAAISGRPQTVRSDAWAEMPMFLLLATTGMMMLTSAMELVTLYISMELAAYPIYIAVALHRSRSIGGESSTKYMLQGMVASAITLYGLSFLFGLSGSTYLGTISSQLGTLATQPLFWLVVLLVLAGFLFKLAAFPFHFWAPDTYQTAPHEVVTFVATASKVAAIAVLCRVVALVAPAGVDAAMASRVLMWMSVAAMTLGNLAALRQGDLKRLLGYSAVAHAGYVLIGIQTMTGAGLTAALFYALGYAAMSALCFLVVVEIGRDEDLVSIESLAGLHQRAPLLAATLLIGLFGLIGLPPTVGFIGKWFLFSAAIEQGQFVFVLVAAINSAVALYYYLLVIRQAYFAEGTSDEPIQTGVVTLAVAGGTTGFVIAMGVVPGWFWARSVEAVAALMG
ncbi:MAG: NADH-quinone oxidoreductase subunit N [Candidatus Latescibacterota bacterium]|jgi:NADH-quinone oxidoreductase subunit N